MVESFVYTCNIHSFPFILATNGRLLMRIERWQADWSDELGEGYLAIKCDDGNVVLHCAGVVIFVN